MLRPSNCCVIGIPDHQGVIHVGGRVGASRGPEAFRSIFYRMSGKNLNAAQIIDRGDVPHFSGEIQAHHRLAAEFISQNHPKEGVSVIIGGGHDHGYSHLKGVLEALQENGSPIRLGCINIDAHLDVRKPDPVITSGSPFYLALESGVLAPERLIEFGIQSHCNGKDLWTYVESKGVKVIPFSDLRKVRAASVFEFELKRLAYLSDVIVISLDLDAVAAGFAPGVSAPQAEGLTPMEVIEMMEFAGRHPKIKSLGIFELNPVHDEDQKTARIAATAAYHFFEAALSERPV